MIDVRSLARCVAVAVLLVLPLAPQAEAADEPGWQGTLGAAVYAVPRYPGADQTDTGLAPMIGVQSPGRRFYLGNPVGGGSPLQLGYRLLDSDGWQVGLDVTGQWRAPRKHDDDRSLQGMDDIDRTLFAGAWIHYRWRMLSVLLRSDSDVLHDRDQGTLLTLSAQAGLPLTPSLVVAMGPVLHWADQTHGQTFYGVSAAQSQSAGLPEHAVGAGIEDVGLQMMIRYRMAAHWQLSAVAGVLRLQGDAADSPVVMDRNQVSGLLSLAWRFGGSGN